MWFMRNDAATDFSKELQANPDRYPDRVAGIVLGTMVDERLTDPIKTHVQFDKKIDETLWHETGLFGSFGARVALGFVMGLYSKETQRDLSYLQNQKCIRAQG
jgi:hypothetical protein